MTDEERLGIYFHEQRIEYLRHPLREHPEPYPTDTLKILYSHVQTPEGLQKHFRAALRQLWESPCAERPTAHNDHGC